MNPNLMLWPIVIYALVTLALYAPMSRARMRTVRDGKVKAGVYKLNIDEPEESRQFSNAIRNQNEIGLPYYAGVLAAYASNNPSYLLATLAWAFLVFKLMHLYVHVTSNSLRLRRPAFSAAFLVLILFWIVFALQLSGIL